MAERLTGEARDRVRASALTFVGGLTILLVAVGLYVTLVGSEQTSVVPSTVVAVSDDGRRVTVELVHRTCEVPSGIAVDERADEVVLTARVMAPTAEDDECLPVTTRESVTLTEPLGTRELRTTRP
ncbi:hypothetical protein [Oceanitalea stevensii]|uniref:NusG domain-containing protein n=1 Tax=Oceanitalea stevensii TaxID=2763072 RepID=A0ABR8Z5M4_9MICO|nr:hypothetical protein [Oceanitalea stevensii]MBD8063549.1 hypothetical protein [Oceanitalea stevensii]